MGSWSFNGDPKEVVSVLDGLRVKIGPEVQVNYAKGTTIKRGPEPALNSDRLPPPPPTDADIDAAVDAAKSSDQVILVLGENDDMSGEYASRASLTLPGNQQQL